MINLVTRLCGKINPLSIKEYKENGGFGALESVLHNMAPGEVVGLIKDSNLKGRGGAAFPTGLKLQLVAAEKSDVKYIICNADEGEPGTFKDRVLLEGCPFQVIEGMVIAAYAAGINKGYVYIREEYPKSREKMKSAVEMMRSNGYLGNNILKQNFNFDIEIRSGAGAYVCGEETALIESIEGNEGKSRFKPPYPPSIGLWGKPTLVNNVETLANIPLIVTIGSEEYKKYGTKSSSGTKLISVSGCIVSRGVYEVEFGTTLKDIIFDICGGVENGRTLKFVQVGGSSGSCIPPSMLDIALDFDEFRIAGMGLGSGAILAADDSTCVVDFLKNTIEFFKRESCGKCTPCREGNRQIIKILDRFSNGFGSDSDLSLMIEISLLMRDASSCGLGQAAPSAIFSAIRYFGEEFKEHINGYCRAHVCSMKGGMTVNE